MANEFKDISSLPPMGVGIGFRKQLREEIIFDHEHIDFIEVIGEHYLTKHNRHELLELMDEYTIIPHFIGTSIGSAQGVDPAYLDKIAELLEMINPPYWSEHISFSETHGIEIGHLTPTPYSNEAIDVFSSNIEKIKKTINHPLVLENITYIINDPVQEYSETEFINQILEINDIGLLLDITNLYANSINHEFNRMEWLEQINLERVIQLHFVGTDQRDGWVIDNHSQPTQNEIWELMKTIADQTPHLKGAILERDMNFGKMDYLREELKKAKSILF